MNTLLLCFCLLTVAGFLQRRQQSLIDYLMAENRVLPERLGPRLGLNDDQRRRLALRAKTVGRAVLGEISTIVTPDAASLVSPAHHSEV